MAKTFIISIPKSGTYLVREILEQMGAGASHLHISETGIYDYSMMPPSEGRSDPGKYKKRMPLKESLKQIPEDSFAMGHLQCTPKAIKLLKNFNLVFIGRDLREVLLSYMIYELETGRALRKNVDFPWVEESDPSRQFIKFLHIRGDKLFTKFFCPILPWRNQAGVECFDFNQLRDNPLAEVERLATAAGRQLTSEHIRRIVDKSFNKKTLTLSTERDRTKYWSAEAQQRVDDLLEKYSVFY